MKLRILLGTILLNGQDVPVIDQLIHTAKSTAESDAQGGGPFGNQGFSFNTVRARMKLLDKLEEAKKAGAEYVDLEKEQFNTLKDVFDHCRWNLIDQGVLDLMDRIADASPPTLVKDTAGQPQAEKTAR